MPSKVGLEMGGRGTLCRGAADQEAAASGDGEALLGWIAEREARGLEHLRGLLGPEQPLYDLPLLPEAPSELGSLSGLADLLAERLDAAAAEQPA